MKIRNKTSRANLAAVSKDQCSDGAFCHRVHPEGHLVLSKHYIRSQTVTPSSGKSSSQVSEDVGLREFTVVLT